jgi:hypothetical protein
MVQRIVNTKIEYLLQEKKNVVGLERGALSLVSTN